MMKSNLLLLLTLLIPHSAFSVVVATDPATQVYDDVAVKEDSTLKKLLVIPEVAAQYKLCQTAYPKALDKIPGCLWQGDPDNNIPALDSTKKDEIKKIYAQEEASGIAKPNTPVDPKSAEIDVTAGKAGNTTNFTHNSVTVGTDYKTDPAVQALSAFFGKKLDEALNGTAQDKKDKKIITVDHTKFIDLYTNELGKSIVGAFTSYCMDTDPSCRVPSPNKDGSDSYPSLCYIKESKTARKLDTDANLLTLKTAQFNEKEGAAWTHCIVTVSNVCYESVDKKNVDQVYTNQRACLVMDFVKAARKSLIAADQQKAFYAGLKGGGSNGIASIATNMKVVDNEPDLTADKLTQITSADVGKEFKGSDNKTENISKTNDVMEKEASDCIASNIQKEKCKKFLDVDTTKNTDAVTEFGLRQFAKADELEAKLTDKASVGSYLTEEGYTASQIDNLLSSQASIDKVKLEITTRFNNEKDAIIREMASKVSAKTTSADGTIDKTADESKLGAIKTDLASRNSDLVNLIHFNNIVSSYLDVTDVNTKASSRNTASLYAEVNSMDNKIESKEMLDNMNKGKLKENQNSSNVNVEDINKLLQYQEEKKADPAN